MENITVVLVLVHFIVSLLMVVPSTAKHMRAAFESNPGKTQSEEAQAQKHENPNLINGKIGKDSKEPGFHQKYSGDHNLWVISLLVCGAILVVEQKRVMRVLGM